MTRLAMTRGDTQAFALTLTDGDGLALDLTDLSLTFTAKLRIHDTDAEALIVKSDGAGITLGDDPTDGTATLTILPADTESLTSQRTLYWDLQVEDSLGAVSTPLSGHLVIGLDVTRTRAGS
jgi:hypothetical protein